MSKSVKRAAKANPPAMRYLDLIAGRIKAIRKDMSTFVDLGERMAKPLLAGGACYIPRVGEFWYHEASGRAGGLMGLKRYKRGGADRKGVAMFSLPGHNGWNPREDEALKREMAGKAKLFVVGRADELDGLRSTRRFSGFTGGADPGAGLYGYGDHRPLVPLRPFDLVVRGWLTTGEMIAACTRAGRMPIIWMSVWFEGALARNTAFIRHDNLAEPWKNAPMFHENRYIPPLAPGYMGGAFLEFTEGLLASLRSQKARLAKAGRWLAQAARKGRRPHVVAVGHSYPWVLDLPAEYRDEVETDYPLRWGWSCSYVRKAHPRSFGEGDVIWHMGYSPVNVEHVSEILDRGVRLIYTSPYGRPEALKDHPNLLWFDLPWRPGDATVDVPGYGVRVMPSSSTAQTLGYFAILAEMAGRMGWK